MRRFSIQMGDETHRHAKSQAALDGLSLSVWIETTLRQVLGLKKLEGDQELQEIQPKEDRGQDERDEK